MVTSSSPPGPGEERVPPGEAADIQAIADLSVAMLRTDVRPVPRGQHPKPHGVVRGEFTVEPGLPEALRHGIFREPRTYACWVRFSSGSQEDDARGDIHGMAIKLLDVDGPKILEGEEHERTQDFVLIDIPVMISRHARSNRALAETMDRSLRPSLLKSLFFWQDARTRRSTYIALRHFVFGLRFHELACLRRAMSSKPASPLTTTYWSTTPYRLGPQAVKYAARPQPSTVPEPTDFTSKDRLRAAMVAHLGQAEARFDFLVQVQGDPAAMPIEDASIEWDEAAAPFQKVATITIPAQVFDTPEQRQFGEDLSYTPWHSLPEHRPLGGINRARKVTYEAVSRRRHELNHAPRREPTAAEGPVPAPPVTTRSVPFHHVLSDELERVRLRRRATLAQDEGTPIGATPLGPEPLGAAAERLRRTTRQRLRDAAHGPDPGAPPQAPATDRTPSDDELLAAARREALEMHLAGLAFSGGGIRSGSFAVGVIQGLASLGLLRRFDLLSTVSGGGYAGGWLAAWLKREGDPRNVERQLSVSRIEQARARREGLAQGQVVDEEPEPLRHLRAYSSYMSPRPGLFTADTWALVAIFFRNILLNFLMLVPATLALVFLVRLVVWLIGFVMGARDAAPLVAVGAADGWTTFAAALAGVSFVTGVVLFIRAYQINGRALPKLRDPAVPEHGTDGGAVTRCVVSFLAAAVLVPAAVPTLLPLLGAAAGQLFQGGGAGLTGYADEIVAGIGNSLRNATFLSVPNVAFHVVFFGTLSWLVSLRVSRRYVTRREDRRRFRWAAFSAGAVGGLLLACAEAALKPLFGAPHWFATLAPPAALGIIIVSIAVLVGVAGRSATEGEREWWARLAGLLGLWAVGWAAVVGAIILLPAVLIGSSAWVRQALAGGYLVATIAGVLSGYSSRTRGDNSGRKAGSGLMEKVAAVAPSLFLIGLLGGAGLLASYLVGDPWVAVQPPEDQTFAQAAAVYFQGFTDSASQCCGPVSFWALLFWSAGMALAALFFGRFVDVNLFSLQAMYANRLTRCFLGASRPRSEWARRWGGTGARGGPVALEGAPTGAAPPPRDPNPVTGFDLEDDLGLHELAIGGPTPAPAAGGGEAPPVYWGPHLILNTELNLIAGTELAWRDRKGESFSLTPLYCGSKTTGYAPMNAEAGRVLTLGRCVAFSGAAVDANMGVYQSGPMTALLTIFNARLGGWIENPTPPPADHDPRPRDDPRPWVAESPKYAGLLLDELLGRTTNDKKYVHISDGGHFENLGVYELVRRRCRYIVAVDAGEDPNASGENLANLVRLCRVDFGVRIQLDTAPLVRSNGLSRAHVVIGRIRYDDVDNGQMPGLLVYIKISLTGDEPPDLQRYAAAHPEFPHQSTLDQMYDEVQFECYRTLGDHVARAVFEDAARRAGPPRGAGDPAPSFVAANRRLFALLRDRWSEPPADQDGALRGATSALVALQRDFRRDALLARLSRDLYPELVPDGTPLTADADDPDPAQEAERRRAELHAVSRMLQVMEDAWTALNLGQDDDLPMDRGWMNVFRRWAGSETFHRYWPALRSEFNADFVRFCETDLRLLAEPVGVEPLAFHPNGTVADTRFEPLAREFQLEWPHHTALAELARSAHALASWHGLTTAWLLTQAPLGQPRARFACGVILAWQDDPQQPVYDFLVWVRRAHRSMDIGGWGIQQVLKPLCERLRAISGGGACLQVRHPASPSDGVGGEASRRNRDLWINFFSLYDFKPLPGANIRDPDAELVLRKNLRGPGGDVDPDAGERRAQTDRAHPVFQGGGT